MSVAAIVAAKKAENEHWWDDTNFQDNLVALLVQDPETCETCGPLLSPEDFRPPKGTRDGRSRWMTAERALEYFQKHNEPLGKLARADLLQYATQLSLGAPEVAELKEYLKRLQALKPVAPDALGEKVIRFKSEVLKTRALDEAIDLQAAGQLTDKKWEELFAKGRMPSQETETPAAAQWPERLRPEALYGLAGDIVKALEPRTEADPAALLLQTLVAFGNVIDRDPHWMHGATRHAVNLFVGIVGSTGTGKGSGLDMVMDMFREVDPKWSANPNTYAGLSSGEGFIYMVRDATYRRKNGKLDLDNDGDPKIDDPGADDKRLLIVQPEFAQVLEVCERAGNTLATKLRNAWDGKPLLNNSLSSRLTATNTHISLIVHSTQDDLRDLMRRTMILNGFGNRFLWVCSRPSKSLPFGGMVPQQERTALVERLRDAVEFAKGLKTTGKWKGRMYFEKPAASNLWVSAYNTSLTRDGESPVTGRAVPQTRRLAHVYALMDCSEKVREEHLRAALETWRYCADSARFIFGGVQKADPVADKILEALRGSGKKGLTRKEISIDVFQRNKSAEEMTRALQTLQKRGQARVQTEASGASGGRPTERWFTA